MLIGISTFRMDRPLTTIVLSLGRSLEAITLNGLEGGRDERDGLSMYYTCSLS